MHIQLVAKDHQLAIRMLSPQGTKELVVFGRVYRLGEAHDKLWAIEGDTTDRGDSPLVVELVVDLESCVRQRPVVGGHGGLCGHELIHVDAMVTLS